MISVLPAKLLASGWFILLKQICRLFLKFNGSNLSTTAEMVTGKSFPDFYYTRVIAIKFSSVK
jgi:hypothetical protein